MSLITVVLVFVIVWWIVFFMALPHGIRTPEKPERPGVVESAPIKPRLWLKAAITTGVAAGLTGLLVLLFETNVISLTDLAGVP